MKMNPQRLARMFQISRFIEAAYGKQFNDDRHVDANRNIHLDLHEFDDIVSSFFRAEDNIKVVGDFTTEEAALVKNPVFASTFHHVAHIVRTIYGRYNPESSEALSRVDHVNVSWKTDKKCTVLPDEYKIDLTVGKRYICFRVFDGFSKVEQSDNTGRVTDTFTAEEFHERFINFCNTMREQFTATSLADFI